MVALRKAYEIKLDSHVSTFQKQLSLAKHPNPIKEQILYFSVSVLLDLWPLSEPKSIWEIVSNSMYPFAFDLNLNLF